MDEIKNMRLFIEADRRILKKEIDNKIETLTRMLTAECITKRIAVCQRQNRLEIIELIFGNIKINTDELVDIKRSLGNEFEKFLFVEVEFSAFIEYDTKELIGFMTRKQDIFLIDRQVSSYPSGSFVKELSNSKNNYYADLVLNGSLFYLCWSKDDTSVQFKKL